MYDCLRRSHTMLFKANRGLGPVSAVGKGKTRGKGKKSASQGSRAMDWGGGRAAEPADMPLKCHVSLSLLCSFCKKKIEFEMSKIASKEIANWRNTSFGEEK